MRSTLTLICVPLCIHPATTAQERMPAGPYAPPDATSVVHVNLKAVRDSLIGTAIAESEIGKAVVGARGKPGNVWAEIESVRIASVARADRVRLRSIWVLHVRGKKPFRIPAWLPTLATDVLVEKKGAFGLIGYFRPAPTELVIGEAEYLRERVAGKKLAASSSAADLDTPYLVRTFVRVPAVGVPRVGTWSLPLLDGVRYRDDPPRAITARLDRDPKTGKLRLYSDVYFRVGGVSANGLSDAAGEFVARALRNPKYFQVWSMLQRLRITVEGRGDGNHGPRARVVAFRLDLPDRSDLDAVLAPYATLAAALGQLRRFQESMTVLDKTVIQQEPEKIVEEERQEPPKIRKGGRKKR